MPVPRLFTHLVDDAAVFPPGNAAMPDAVAAHAVHRQAWYAEMVGPLLCPDTRIDELASHIDADTPLPVVVVVTAGADGVRSAIEAARSAPRLDLVTIEVAARGAFAAAEVTRIAADAAAAGVPVVVEVPVGDEAALDAVATAGAVAKLRTGGEQAEAFPTEEQVAAFVLACLQRGVAFKCTAGLHEAVRHTAGDTGFEHHGFLNLLLAVRVALEGGAVPDVAAALALRDEAEVVAGIGRIDEVDAAAVRARLRSYGSCSITEPVDELVRLGLLAPAHT